MIAQFTEFAAAHPLLFIAFFGLLGALVWTFFGPAGGSRKVTPIAATRLINDEDAVVVDVRGDSEFNEGHVVNALHIPMNYLKERMDKLEKYRNRTIIPICRNGQQSAVASATLRKHGFEKVFNVSGGIVAWREANLPLVKK